MKLPSWVIRELENGIMPTLRNCTSMGELRQLHAHILVFSLSQSNFLGTQIINICNSNRRVDYAALVFNQVYEPNVFLYNAMIKAYAQNYHCSEAISLYKQMLNCQHAQNSVLADRFTYPFVLKACAGLLLLVLGKLVHVHIFKSGLTSNSIIQNSLIEMYTKCDHLVDARRVFDEMEDRDAVSWNTLISAHARLGQMRKARALFNSMPSRTVVSWTALISGYTMAGRYFDAVEVFHHMQLESFEPDDISIVSVLPACAQLGALELGKWIHAYCDKHELLQKSFICNALIEMYAKCGSIDQALQLFEEMKDRDVISWSTMIAGLASHGQAHKAIKLFVEMEKDKRVRPNGITFIGLLSACSHAGLLDEGFSYFDSMKEVYGIDPGVEHYGCMVDLLGRSGCIDRAVQFIESMPVPPDAAVWGSLLSACGTHGNIGTAVKAMEQLIELEPEDIGNYVMLSNIYAAARRWDSVAKLRRVIRSKSLKKTPGCSLIEVNNVVQEFVAGNDSNPHFGEISGVLYLLASQLGHSGYQRAMEYEE
ncbi:pentatricopeptide repeat-containing protein At2g20540 [Elaeis guineensis]|uniref:Pentatricopeptide repeat-containing protein At2g20540 n=1 Tax=Elaeis guineensis var. tenera TaxID=51953 RepID=A0A6I9QMZ6_ELAGV|nr:pentatricopeptide repeat-containing protein At2g20540 [Elaeis guineensis]